MFRVLVGAVTASVIAWAAMGAEGRWSYSPPGGEGDGVVLPFHRAEIIVENGIATLLWRPKRGDYALYLVHRGWDNDASREITASYGAERRETILLEAERIIETAAGHTDLRFSLPESFLEHLVGANELILSRAGGGLKFPLTGSLDAIATLVANRDVEIDLPEAEQAADAGAECDLRAAWAGDPERVGPAVQGTAMDANAALMACFAALKDAPSEPRYLFQLARAMDREGLSAADQYLAKAEELGYRAAAAYRSATAAER